MEEGHLPVMPEEVMSTLAPASGSLQIDATLGGGGHTERILEATSPDGRLLGLDADGAAIARVARRLGAGSAIASSSARRTSASSRPSRPTPASTPSTAPVRPRACRASSWPTRSAASASGPAARSTCASTPAGASRPRELLATPRRSTSWPRCSAGSARSRRRAASPGRSSRPAGRTHRDRRGAGRARRARRTGDPREPTSDPSRDPRLPGPADRRQRGAGRSPAGPRRRGRPPATRRPARRAQLPLARGPHRQAVLPGRATRLHLPARGARVRCGKQPRLRLVTRPSLTPTAAEVAANPRARSARLARPNGWRPSPSAEDPGRLTPEPRREPSASHPTTTNEPLRATDGSRTGGRQGGGVP